MKINNRLLFSLLLITSAPMYPMDNAIDPASTQVVIPKKNNKELDNKTTCCGKETCCGNTFCCVLWNFALKVLCCRCCKK